MRPQIVGDRDALFVNKKVISETPALTETMITIKMIRAITATTTTMGSRGTGMPGFTA
jgi:hypothetical protein